MTTVAFQGEPGAFSELAALQFFGRKALTRPFAEFGQVFRAVESGKVNFGMIPIENSLSGSIHQNYDLLLQRSVWICGELKLRVSHCLIANPGVPLNAVKSVYSHPQALAQCVGSLHRLGGVRSIPHYDTAGSVKYIREQGFRDAAALASLRAARVYRMKVLKTHMEDNEKNFTRFFAIARRSAPAGGKAKTSIVFALKNIPGALYKSLAAFADQGVDLHKIESRPIAGSPWRYQFYLDFAGNAGSLRCRKALAHLREITESLRVLGSYRPGKEAGS